jgi:hypothetical protein
MNLEDFVAESLSQIIHGVKKAQEATKGKDAVIVPHNLTGGKVDFDVAVNVVEGKEQSGKAGISVWSIGADVSGKTESSTSTASRIKFSIAVDLPKGNEGRPGDAGMVPSHPI